MEVDGSISYLLDVVHNGNLCSPWIKEAFIVNLPKFRNDYLRWCRKNKDLIK